MKILITGTEGYIGLRMAPILAARGHDVTGLDTHFFEGCTEAQTRAEVRRCFEAAGTGGGFILSPSDHFFDADPALVRAFADEASRCAN